MKCALVLLSLLVIRFAMADSNVSEITDPPHCVALCTGEDTRYTYCIEVGCCGFVRLAVTTPMTSFGENGKGTVDKTVIQIASPQTELNATAETDAYHGTLTVTQTGQSPITEPVTCPLVFTE